MPRCDHIAFRVADLDRSIAFYEAVVPARLVSRTRHADRWRTEVAALRPAGQDDFTIVLLCPRRVRWLLRLFHAWVPRQTRSHEHVGFALESREELEERAAAARVAGARIVNPIQRMGEGDAWLLEVLDPDRNALEWVVGGAHAEPGEGLGTGPA